MYNDVAKDSFYAARGKSYADLADPQLLVRDPNLFWKFWGDCATSYRCHEPHLGYHILNSWCKNLPKLCREIAGTPNPFYVYTSNVDGYFRKFDRLGNFLTEIHGCVEESVCSSSIGYIVSRHRVTPDSDGEVAYRQVTQERMSSVFSEWNSRLSHEERRQCSEVMCVTPALSGCRTSADCGRTTAQEEGADYSCVPMCPLCGKCPLRPCVVMFGDSCPNVIPRIWGNLDAYQRWEGAMEVEIAQSYALDGAGPEGGDCEERGKKVVILELGCGLRVPSVRIEGEEVLRDINAAVNTAGAGDDAETAPQSSAAVLIRINLEDADIDNDVKESNRESFGIRMGCRDALETIDQFIQIRMALR